MATFTDLFLGLDNLGIGDSLLPFLLIFVVVFAVLEKTKIIGEGRRNFNVVFSFIMALLVVIPHITGRYPPNQDVVTIINTAVPNVMVMVVGIVVLLLLTGVFGYAPLNFASSGFFSTIFIFASAGTVLYFFGLAAGLWQGAEIPPFLSFMQDPDTRAIIAVIASFVVIIGFITGGGPDTGKLGSMFGGAMDEFKKLLGGGR